MNGNWNTDRNNQTAIKNAMNQLDTTSVTLGIMRNKWANYSTNLNFKHVIDSTGKKSPQIWTMPVTMPITR
jgi:hypothetical protein